MPSSDNALAEQRRDHHIGKCVPLKIAMNSIHRKILRLIGATSLLIGVALVVAAFWGWRSTESMVASWQDIDAERWTFAWKLWSAYAGLFGAGVALSGVTMIAGRVAGLLLLSVVLLLGVVPPWLLLAADQIDYAYQSPSVLESVVALILAACSFLYYLRARRCR